MKKLRLGLDSVNEVLAAWAAGFFDGEGHVGFHKHSSRKQETWYRLSLTIAQKDRQVLDKFYNAVGGIGRVLGPYTHGKNKIDYYMYNCGSEAGVKEIFNLLSPYLSSVKAGQFADAILKFDTWKQGQHYRHVAAGKKAMQVRWHGDVAQFPRGGKNEDAA